MSFRYYHPPVNIHHLSVGNRRSGLSHCVLLRSLPQMSQWPRPQIRIWSWPVNLLTLAGHQAVHFNSSTNRLVHRWPNFTKQFQHFNSSIFTKVVVINAPCPMDVFCVPQLVVLFSGPSTAMAYLAESTTECDIVPWIQVEWPQAAEINGAYGGCLLMVHHWWLMVIND